MEGSGSAPELNLKEERSFIRDIAITVEAIIQEGDIFHLLSQRQWQGWLDYVNEDMNQNISQIISRMLFDVASKVT
ncbi:hypothetical protein COCNU_02G000750 [Cocos nucifera]|uniref:Uncharacterized protein n=1 Tax=Cocos nucifera TaxID=13894 RepID=A0A8K0HY32_COCNU|nr:hypothetical protein COCNU_02G000740 [Cocos nucifera]KAG1330107.1 hypothetical protein COCNU_02G000750 [Cocos nucifera]